ncbi:MAG: tetratricopeptide repeat protein [Acidobacteria bacterium]|nr:tetratricopeptide repeat protein [Acidobacteriota bacterium]
MYQYFTRQDVCNILSIREGRLQYWHRIGLVSPSLRQKRRTFYGFQDLICLKTAEGLVGRGIPAKKIKHSISALKKRFPEFDENLCNKRIYVVGNRVIISHKNRLIDHSGQLLFKFDVDEFAKEIENRVRLFGSQKTADDWFREGLSHDRHESTYELALNAYRQVVKLDPDYADAYVNMGTIYYNQRKFLEAERYYRLALARDPYHARACFNLGNALDEMNCVEKAAEFYEKALEIDPLFADAHYNLAVICEKWGQPDRAIKHWKRYLALEPESKAAATARKRLRLLQFQQALALSRHQER